MNKTEQLKVWIFKILFPCAKPKPNIMVDLILQACKKEGLKFVPDELNLTYIKRPSTPDSVWWEQTKEAISKDINLQIEELEL